VEILQFDSAHDAALALAEDIADAVRRQPALTIGLPAGKTPIPVYEALRNLHRVSDLDFSRTRVFMLDEFVGSAAFRDFLHHHLLDGINVHGDHVYSLDGGARDLDGECASYDVTIATVGGIDLQVLGLGGNGHVGFNEPSDALAAATHVASLTDATRQQNAGLFDDDPAAVPARALTMGLGTILKASRIALIATGSHKADAVSAMIRGPLTTWCPASLLQTHRSVGIYLDRAASARLNA
jgi:glucosamine-6-phosphate deaminase